MVASSSALRVFSHATLVAIRLAADPKTRQWKQAEYAAYANARAAARAALVAQQGAR